MKVNEMYCIKNGEALIISPSPQKRKITIPKLMTSSRGQKTKAHHRLDINGKQVAIAEVDTRYNQYGVTLISISSWSGIIEPNTQMKIMASERTSKYSSVLSYVLVLIE